MRLLSCCDILTTAGPRWCRSSWEPILPRGSAPFRAPSYTVFRPPLLPLGFFTPTTTTRLLMQTRRRWRVGHEGCINLLTGPVTCMSYWHARQWALGQLYMRLETPHVCYEIYWPDQWLTWATDMLGNGPSVSYTCHSRPLMFVMRFIDRTSDLHELLTC